MKYDPYLQSQIKFCSGMGQNRSNQYMAPPPFVLPVSRIPSGVPAPSRPVLVRSEFTAAPPRKSVIPNIIQGQRSITTIQQAGPIIAQSTVSNRQPIGSHTSLQNHLMDPTIRMSRFQAAPGGAISVVQKKVITQVDPLKQSSVYLRDSHVRSSEIIVPPSTLKVMPPLMEPQPQSIIVEEQTINRPITLPLPPPMSNGPFIGQGIVVGSSFPPGSGIPFPYLSTLQPPGSVIQTRILSPQGSRFPGPSYITSAIPSTIPGPMVREVITTRIQSPSNINETTLSRIPAPLPPPILQSQPQLIPIQMKPISAINSPNLYTAQAEIDEMPDGGQSRRILQAYDLEIDPEEPSLPVYTFDYDQQSVDTVM